MADFLDRVAKRLYDLHGDEMEKQIVVLPSRRAGLWLTRSLAGLNRRPAWSPEIITVSGLFHSFTSLIPADYETQIFELFKIHRLSFGGEMGFDEFWPWGEVIINDFNDIDLYLADASKLYTNIHELKEIDSRFGGITPEQAEIIRGFWSSFNPSPAEESTRAIFSSVWERLGPLYVAFRKAMSDRGMAGDGMLCRDVAEKALAGTLRLPSDRKWHVAGLNALNNCEKTLFLYLKQMGRADFYWDDDHFFMDEPEHTASRFIRENIRLFGNSAPGREPQQQQTPQEKREQQQTPDGKWHIIDTPTDTAQAGMAARLLEKVIAGGEDDLTSTAVVLADEKLLMPLLGSLPAAANEVNVTMGYPFRMTPLYSFLKQLTLLIRSARGSGDEVTFRSDDILALLRHQYFKLLTGDEGEMIAGEIIRRNMIRVDRAMLLETVRFSWLLSIPAGGAELPEHLAYVIEKLEDATFRVEEEGGASMSTDREYMRMAMSGAIRLANLFRSYDMQMRIETSARLLERYFRKMMVPFAGEPLRGIQIMGVLETRALEFKNIIFLSLNEGIFPKISFDNTYIPYNIRRAFGLPTVNEHESVFSYYFFRLLRKTEKGWFLYNSTAQGLTSGEMSRYLIRMIYTPEFAPVRQTVSITVGRSNVVPELLPKTEVHQQALLNRYCEGYEGSRFLSPSAVNTWLYCRMQFYYKYVCRMPEEELLEKEIDQRRFGNIMHETLFRLYKPLEKKGNAGINIAALAAETERIREIITAAAAEEMKWSRESVKEGRGVVILNVLERYVRELLEYDGANHHLTLLNLEDDFTGVHDLDTTSGKIRVRVGGRVDRVDLTDGVVRVVDYKTGAPKLEKVRVEELFDEEKDKHNDAVTQALIYCTLIEKEHPGRMVLPAIYWVQKLSSDQFTPYVDDPGLSGPSADRNGWEEFFSSFRHYFGVTLNKIFSVSEDYVMTQYRRRCDYCPYRALCGR